MPLVYQGSPHLRKIAAVWRTAASVVGSNGARFFLLHAKYSVLTSPSTWRRCVLLPSQFDKTGLPSQYSRPALKLGVILSFRTLNFVRPFAAGCSLLVLRTLSHDSVSEVGGIESSYSLISRRFAILCSTAQFDFGFEETLRGQLPNPALFNI
jgi:hypothetical protein